MSIYNLRPYIGGIPLIGGYSLEPYINTDGGVPLFISTWNTELTDATASATKTIVLPMTAGPLVDWGDGTTPDNLNSHVYALTGTYEIIIDNTNSDFRFNNLGDKVKITDVSQCNGLNVTNDSVFERCVNMTWSATDAPVIASTSLNNMFEGCEALNGSGSFSKWDLSLCTSLTNMFFGCFDFLGSGLEDWDVGSCSNFAQMFFAANVFAAPIGVWNMISATTISGMFRSASNFNVDVNAWDTSNIQTMNHVFNGTSFTHDLDNWDMGSAVTIHAMFGSTAYNGDITGWVFTSTISDISWIFAGATSFNRDISGWNVASATNLSNMFGGASAFDQDLTGWLIPNATNLATMLDNCGMSTANYDAFLIMLEAQEASINSGLTLGAQSLTYTSAGAGGTARTGLLGSPALMSFVGDSGV
jgi:surface protein